MSLEAVPRGSIVVGVDGSEHSHDAVDWAAAEAARRKLPLHLMHALDDLLSSGVVPEEDRRRAEGDVVAQGAASRAHLAHPELAISAQTPRGSVSGLLVEASSVADTIVVGARGRGAARSRLLGSVSQQVAIHARCPVVVTREHASIDGAAAGRVVVGVDGSEVSSAAIAYAFNHAASTGAGLTVVHAWWWEYLEGVMVESPWGGNWEEIAEQELVVVSESLAGWSEKHPDVDVARHVVRGHPVDLLVEESAGADLLVVGSRGRGGFAGLLLGSVSQGALHHARCPVAVVRQPED